MSFFFILITPLNFAIFYTYKLSKISVHIKVVHACITFNSIFCFCYTPSIIIRIEKKSTLVPLSHTPFEMYSCLFILSICSSFNLSLNTIAYKTISYFHTIFFNFCSLNMPPQLSLRVFLSKYLIHHQNPLKSLLLK